MYENLTGKKQRTCVFFNIITVCGKEFNRDGTFIAINSDG